MVSRLMLQILENILQTARYMQLRITIKTHPRYTNIPHFPSHYVLNDIQVIPVIVDHTPRPVQVLTNLWCRP